MTTPPSKNEHDRWAQNAADHGLIKDTLHELRLAVVTTNERVNSSRTVAIVVWTLFLVGLGGIGWVVNQAAQVIQDVGEQVQTVDSRQQANTARGWEWAASLEAKIKANKEDIDDLQKELHRPRPGKD